MTPSEIIVPRKQCGRPDWMSFVRVTWQVLGAVVIVTLWVGARIEDNEAKQTRIDTTIAPLRVHVTNNAAAIDELKKSHVKMSEAVGRIDRGVAKLVGRHAGEDGS